MTTPADTEQDTLILDSLGRFLDREVKLHVHALEHDDIYPADIVEGMKALGLFGATAPIMAGSVCRRRPTRRSSSASPACGCPWRVSSTRI
jgi:alkylation response protein AidB-like acyl-CoA dehydrogenase